MHELFADVTYFKAAGDGAYAFMVDFTGRVVIHPFQPSPNTVNEDPIVTDISAFEQTLEVQEFLKTTIQSISNNRGPTGNLLKERDFFEGIFNVDQIHPNVTKHIILQFFYFIL